MTSPTLSNQLPAEQLHHQIAQRQWFYDYDFPSGQQTRSYLPAHVQAIHPTRRNMLDSAIAQAGLKLDASKRCIDIACHQGYYTVHLARTGASVLAVDARADHVHDSSLVVQAFDLSNVTVEQHDMFTLSPERQGMFDLTLMYGLLYHIENPIGALRIARAMTKPGGIFVIETQVAPGMSGVIDYGSYTYTKDICGSFVVVDESQELDKKEASVTGICLVPSTTTLMWLLQRVGFSHVQLVTPPEDAHEQLKYGKRVVVWARV